MEVRITTSTFIYHYKHHFELYDKQLSEDAPNITEFKQQLLSMSTVYDISPILTRLDYIYAKVLQNIFEIDEPMLNIFHKRF